MNNTVWLIWEVDKDSYEAPCLLEIYESKETAVGSMPDYFERQENGLYKDTKDGYYYKLEVYEVRK